MYSIWKYKSHTYLVKKIILIIQQLKLPNVYLNGSSTTWHTNDIWVFECRTLHLKCSGNNKHEAKFIPSSKEPVLSTHYVMGTPVRATGTQILLLQDTQLWCDHSHQNAKKMQEKQSETTDNIAKNNMGNN